MNRRISVLAAVCAAALLSACGKKEAAAPAAPQANAETAAVEGAPAATTAADISGDDLRRRVEILASDEFEGRAPATPGGEKTREYIAGEFKRLGLDPVAGSYFQEVPMVEATLVPEESHVSFKTPAGDMNLQYKKDLVFGTKRVEESVSFDNSDVIFAGYGVVAPEYQWNDFEGVDVKGKTIIVLINDPGFLTRDASLFNGNAMTYYGRWTYKFEEAARQGAAGVFIVHDTEPAAYGWGVVEGSWSGPQLDLERADGGASRAVTEGWITNETARALLASAGQDLDALTAAANRRGFKPVPLPGVTASAKVVSKVRHSKDANVIGVLKGSQAPDEYVLYMAHWDHLGNNPGQEGEDKIFNGAVDNATGVAAMLEIAEKFATGAEKPKRSVLFAAVTGEESGLLGSAYLGESPPVPLKDIVGGMNIDAILPTSLTKDMVVVGYGASQIEDILKEKASAHGKTLTADPEPEKGYFYRSDHISLAKKGVPMIYADGGADLREGGVEGARVVNDDYRTNRYHKPADEIDASWDFTDMTDTSEILYETGADMANSGEWPNWYDGNEFRALRDAQRSGN